MVQIDGKKDWTEVAEAIVIWTGWGNTTYPIREETELVKHFGKSVAEKLLPIIQELETAFYLSDARHIAIDLADMAKMASAQFRKKYPEIPEDAVSALAWCYTYDYK